MKMQAVRQHHVDQWVSAMINGGSQTGKPLAPGTVRLALIMLKQVTEYAARQGLVARDPAQYAQAPRQRATKIAPTDVWTREQVQAFAAKAAGHRLYAAFLLACHGLRRSEVCGMRWADIDFEVGTSNNLTSKSTAMSMWWTSPRRLGPGRRCRCRPT